MSQPTTVHVYARTEYAEPLEHLRDVELDDPADLSVDEATGGGDWLEVAVVPAHRLVWVIRDGELVDRAREEVPA